MENHDKIRKAFIDTVKRLEFQISSISSILTDEEYIIKSIIQ